MRRKPGRSSFPVPIGKTDRARRTGCSLVGVLVLATAAEAEPFGTTQQVAAPTVPQGQVGVTGQTLLSWRGTGGETAYIAGAIEGMLLIDAAYEQAVGRRFRTWCAPDRYLYAQTDAIVFKYLESHPDQWHLDGVALVYVALHEAWPCSE